MAATKIRRVVSGGLEWRSDSETVVVEGYASTFGQPYDMGWYTETVRSGAFTKTLSSDPDVSFLVNHDGLPLARTLRSRTLELSQDSSGLYTRAKLDPSDPDVQRVLPKVRRGDMDKMSFGFRTIRDEWSNDYEAREMVELSLANGDVSVVTDPANPNTSIGIRMRAFADANPEQVRAAYKALREEREGKTISSATRDQLVSLLESMDSINDGIESASEDLDGAFDVLNSLLGVTVPDADDDAEGEPSEDAERSAPKPAMVGVHPSVVKARAALELLRH